MLATLIVAMLTGYHNHVHGASLLIVPMLADLARDKKGDPLPPWFLSMMLLPTLGLELYGNLAHAAWCLIGIMAVTYTAIFAEMWKTPVAGRIPGQAPCGVRRVMSRA